MPQLTDKKIESRSKIPLTSISRETWITIYDNDYSQFYLSGFCVQA